MNKTLKFYTILISIFCILILAVYPKYLYLVWNMFLAYVSFYLSFNYITLKNKYIKGLNVFLALIFYPNSIYLFTDLIHISRLKFYAFNGKSTEYIMNFEAWLYLCILFISCFLAVKLSCITIKNYVSYFGHKHKIYITVSLLTGIAVFIGRFIRLNSWDLIIHPFKTTIVILSHITAENIKYMALFFIIQMFVIYIENESSITENSLQK